MTTDGLTPFLRACVVEAGGGYSGRVREDGKVIWRCRHRHQDFFAAQTCANQKRRELLAARSPIGTTYRREWGRANDH